MDPDAVVYYFSGSGNSLAVARDIAAGCGGELTAIASAIDEERITTDADIMGIVFPVYHGGLPNIVTRFCEKIGGLEKKYIFAVCTHGGSPALAIEHLADAVEARGGKLAAGFAVRMPFNYIGWSRRLREVDEETQKEMFDNWKSRSQGILAYFAARKTGTFETSSERIARLVESLRLYERIGKRAWLRRAGYREHTDLTFRESIRLMDRGFAYDENCDGCGICSRVCPVRDIEIVEERPVWRQRCEQCFACLQWCPKEAIQFGSRTAGGKRYHHPDIRVKDMLRRD